MFLRKYRSPVPAFGRAGETARNAGLVHAVLVMLAVHPCGTGPGTPTVGAKEGPWRPICYPLGAKRYIWHPGYPPSHLPGTAALPARGL